MLIKKNLAVFALVALSACTMASDSSPADSATTSQSRDCKGRVDRTFDQWCDDNCNHNPSFCPTALCTCNEETTNSTCVAVGSFSKVPGANEWCVNVCTHEPPFCPASYCSCEAQNATTPPLLDIQPSDQTCCAGGQQFLFFSEAGDDSSIIYKQSLTDGSEPQVCYTFEGGNPTSMVTDSEGNLWVADPVLGTVSRMSVDCDNSTVETLTSWILDNTIPMPTALAIVPGEGVLISGASNTFLATFTTDGELFEATPLDGSEFYARDIEVVGDTVYFIANDARIMQYTIGSDTFTPFDLQNLTIPSFGGLTINECGLFFTAIGANQIYFCPDIDPTQCELYCAPGQGLTTDDNVVFVNDTSINAQCVNTFNPTGITSGCCCDIFVTNQGNGCVTAIINDGSEDGPFVPQLVQCDLTLPQAVAFYSVSGDNGQCESECVVPVFATTTFEPEPSPPAASPSAPAASPSAPAESPPVVPPVPPPTSSSASGSASASSPGTFTISASTSASISQQTSSLSSSFSTSSSQSQSVSTSSSESPVQTPSLSFSPSFAPSFSPSISPTIFFSFVPVPVPAPGTSETTSTTTSFSPSPSPSLSTSSSPSIAPSPSPSLSTSTSPSFAPSPSTSISPSTFFSFVPVPVPVPVPAPGASETTSTNPTTSISPSISPSPGLTGRLVPGINLKFSGNTGQTSVVTGTVNFTLIRCPPGTVLSGNETDQENEALCPSNDPASIYRIPVSQLFAVSDDSERIENIAPFLTAVTGNQSDPVCFLHIAAIINRNGTVEVCDEDCLLKNEGQANFGNCTTTTVPASETHVRARFGAAEALSEIGENVNVTEDQLGNSLFQSATEEICNGDVQLEFSINLMGAPPGRIRLNVVTQSRYDNADDCNDAEVEARRLCYNTSLNPDVHGVFGDEVNHVCVSEFLFDASNRGDFFSFTNRTAIKDGDIFDQNYNVQGDSSGCPASMNASPYSNLCFSQGDNSTRQQIDTRLCFRSDCGDN